jgi:hypothetical protein
LQSKVLKVSEPIADVAAAELPCKGADCFAAAKVGPLDVALGDVVALEDEDDEAGEPLLGLVQCIWHEGAVAEAEIQVRCC